MRILELCVILLEKKKKREKKIHTGVELYVKSDTACSESGCSLVCNRVPAVPVQKLFPAICLRGWKTSPRRCILESAPSPSSSAAKLF